VAIGPPIAPFGSGWCGRGGLFIVGPVKALATQLLGTNLGSPQGVTKQAKWVHQLWHITYWFAVPIGLLVLGLIIWCVFRYRVKAGSDRRAEQFQYHIPIEAAYTIIPLIIVAIVFGFMYNAENHVNAVSKNPDIRITVEGFQWGWRFDYPNGHMQVGTVANELDINSENDLPVLVIPTDKTVQLHVVSLDVVHTFYVPEFLFQRDMIPGVNNTFDINVTTPGVYPGQCNNICGEYHAYMRFLVDAMTPSEFDTWYSQQAPGSITTAGEPSNS
jgi:cytochrome c oxidase subunit II